MQNKSFFVKVFNIKQEEVLIFTLLFLHSFFLNIFISFQFVPANSVFVQHYDSKYLPIAYMAAGVVGYLFTSLYSIVQKRISNKRLFIGALSFMFVVTLISRIAQYFVNEKVLSFLVFIQAWPFISLSAIVSGGMIIKFLDLRQVKRLFGLINIGGIVSSIISYFAIPLINPFLSHNYDLLHIANLGLIASVITITYIYKHFGRPGENSAEENLRKKPNLKFGDLIKQSYFRYIIISATMSMVVLYFVDFSYLSSIKVQAKAGRFESAGQISSFIALVCAFFKIGEFTLSYFSNRVLSKYGVKIGLVALPLALTFFTFLATVTSFTLGVSSILFFVFMVANKSSERIFRRGLDDPSFNVLYQPLHDDHKLAVQTQVGVVMQGAIGIAGFLLWGISQLLSMSGTFRLDLYFLFFLPLLLTWVYVAFKLYDSYRTKLREILAEKNRTKDKKTLKGLYASDILSQRFYHSDIETVRMSITIVSETDPNIMEAHVSHLLSFNDKTINIAILHNIDPTWEESISKDLKQVIEINDDELVRTTAIQALKHLDYSELIDFNDLNLEGTLSIIAESGSQEEKMQLIRLIYNEKEAYNDLILTLLNDDNKLVKQAAIRLAGTRRSVKLNKKLVELLNSEQYINITASVILKNADAVMVEELEKLLNATSDIRVILKTIEIYGKIGSEQSQRYLLKHINYPDKEIQLAVIQALYYSQFQANDRERVIIKQKIEDIISNIVWLYASISDVESEKNTLKLIQSLDLEREANFEILFRLLSFIYQPATIDLIKTNIIGENTIFALEIIDNFINIDIKQLIIPLFDSLSLGQKIKKLSQFFPQQRLKFTDRLRAIIVRDYDKINEWTMAKAIELIGKIHKNKKTDEMLEDSVGVSKEIKLWTSENISKLLSQIRRSEMPDEIFLCLHHTNELVYGTAARVIYDENSMRCIDYLKKLSPRKQELIEILGDEIAGSRKMVVDKVKLIKRVPLFFSIPENVLVKFSEILNINKIAKGESIDITKTYNKEDIFIVLTGVIAGDDGSQFKKNMIIVPGLNLNDTVKLLVAKRETLILQGNRFKYFNLLTNEPDIIRFIFD